MEKGERGKGGGRGGKKRRMGMRRESKRERSTLSDTLEIALSTAYELKPRTLRVNIDSPLSLFSLIFFLHLIQTHTVVSPSKIYSISKNS